jgi:hypothetical protein
MEKFFTFLVLLGFSSFGQNLHHQMQSSQGSSIQLPNGVYVSQTIGQQSVIGNHNKDDILVGQGYQQSNWYKFVSSNENNVISTVVYPNPFVDVINFRFSEVIQGPINVLVFDINGRIVLQLDKLTDQNILTIDMPNLPEAQFLVKLSTPNFTYHTQIIKKL